MDVKLWEAPVEVTRQPVDVFADRNITVQAVPLVRRPWRPLAPDVLQSHAELVRHKVALVEAMFNGRFPAAFAESESFAPAAGTEPTALGKRAASLRLADDGSSGADDAPNVSPTESAHQARRQRRHWLTEPLAPTVVPLDDRVLAYVVKTADLPGKFDNERAKALQIPRGPLYSKLVRGETITLPDGRMIQPSDCVGPPRVGPVQTLSKWEPVVWTS